MKGSLRRVVSKGLRSRFTNAAWPPNPLVAASDRNLQARDIWNGAVQSFPSSRSELLNYHAGSTDENKITQHPEGFLECETDSSVLRSTFRNISRRRHETSAGLRALPSLEGSETLRFRRSFASSTSQQPLYTREPEVFSSQNGPEGGKEKGKKASATRSASSSSAPSIQEASAEACDEAVEGLDEVRSKARAAREAVRKGQGVVTASFRLVLAVLTRAWQLVLSIGPFMLAVARMSRSDWATKIRQWTRHLIHELRHYWVGTKLLWADVRISSRLLLKTANGKSLSRRERQQLTRTSADIFRLVPFAVFIIVPFMEFLLPVALRLFPNMLPSTFQDKMKEEEKLKRKLKARLEMARFLQETVGEMALEVKRNKTTKGEVKETAEELQKFMTKVHTGSRVSNKEIVGFASLFNDELTLDNISRPRLVSMCKYMGLQTFGTDAYLRYILRAKLAWIKEDDKMIQSEGVESLSETELRNAVRERGMLGLLSEEEMRQQLRDWLDLSLKHAVPSSLLILSRAFLVAGRIRPEEAVQATLSSLPSHLVDTVGKRVPKEGTVAAAAAEAEEEDSTAVTRRKLELLQEEERLIKEEEAAEKLRQQQEMRTADEAAAAVSEGRDLALEEMQEDTAAARATAAATAAATVTSTVKEKKEEGERKEAAAIFSETADRIAEKKEQMCQLSAALSVLAASSSVAKERADFLKLVNNEIGLYNRMVEKEGTEGAEEAKVAYHAARQASEQAVTSEASDVSGALINKVDSMLVKLEKELDAVDAKIGDRLKILDTDHDGKVTPEELATAATFLRDSLGQEPIQELIANLAKDQDGKILVEDIVKLGSLAKGASHKPDHTNTSTSK